jgi:citronellol/citronellal dehydrogenase
MTELAQFGFSDAELVEKPTVFKSDLFAGQTVVVTGAGSGLGKAIAALYARLGADLIIAGRNEERMAAAQVFLGGLGSGAVHSQLMTIRDPEMVQSLIDFAWSETGRLDVVVNNAGGQFPQAALDFKVKGWNAVIDTNLNGTWYMMQSAARSWVERGVGGNIVNIIALHQRGMPGIAHTAAARAGVEAVSRSVAVEWAPLNIRVNCVAPGCVETSGFGQYPLAGQKSISDDANPLRHPGDAWDIAEAVVYASSSAGKFITGETINVDGGQQLWGDPWPTGRPEHFE